MNLASLGNRRCLGLAFLHVAQLLLDLQGYVFICLDHDSREVISEPRNTRNTRKFISDAFALFVCFVYFVVAF